jgi:hypothetical protein|tara:strand:- start:502 stop:996 length:495 start_codon:yes stop_codon:yes gene_type:complete
MKIIDNFIDQESFNKLKDTMYDNGGSFPWYHCHYKNFKGDGMSQFVHMFFTPYNYCSDFHPLIHPILDRLNATALIRIKANLTMKTPKPHICDFHTDVVDYYKHSKTAVFYINNNNGYTLFKKGKKKVESVENRIVIFDAKQEHTTVTQTDTNIRIVINLNFYN